MDVRRAGGWRVAVTAATISLLGCGGGTGDGGDGGSPGRPDAGPDARADAADSGGGAADASAGDALPPDDGGASSAKDALCRRRWEELEARPTARVLRVEPADDGFVTVEGMGRMTLRAAVRLAEEGDVVELRPGTYVLPEAGPDEYTGLYFTTPRVTLVSSTRNPEDVVIDGAYRSLGGQSGLVTVDAPGVVIAGVTLKRAVFHLLHFWSNGDGSIVHDVVLQDAGQQFLKSSPRPPESIDDVEVSCTVMRMTSEGRDNVWGYGAPDGNTTCYTGGIDAHEARNWWIHDSHFEGIYCDPSGVPRPAHGRFPELRDGRTYQGGLAEYAIHLWESEEGYGHVIERNRIVDCARGIGLGMRDDVYDIVVRNNMVSSRFDGSREHDVGIAVERGRRIVIEHNTVIGTASSPYPNAIEYRWDVSSELVVRNNLTNLRIRARDGASASLSGNVTSAEPAWFRDAARGDLHLASCAQPSVVDAGDSGAGTMDDYDGERRDGAPDVGADECSGR